MFNNIVNPFIFANHVEFSAFYQKDYKDYITLLNEMELTLKNEIESNTANSTSEKEISRIEDEFIILSILQKMKDKLIVVPSLYNFECELDLDDIDSETVDIDIGMDLIEALLNKNVWGFPEQPLNESFSSISNATSKVSIGLLEDRYIKEIVLNRQIDVVLNLDSFVKFILFHLKDLQEDCYIPFLKFNINEMKGSCLIFDKPLSKRPNLSKEKSKYLKHLILENHKKTDLLHGKRFTRITKSNLGVKVSSANDALTNFIKNINHENFDKNIQCDNSTNITHKTIFENKINIENDGNQNWEDLTIDDQSSKYSYAIWNLMGLNVLFRLKSFYRILNKPEESQNVPECAYIRVHLGDREVKNNSEEIWKSFFGSKINFDSDIMQIILNMKTKCIQNVKIESMQEFKSKNPIIESNYQAILKFLKNCFGSLILSNRYESDFYMLNLTNNEIKIYRSTEEENRHELDLKTFVNLDTI